MAKPDLPFDISFTQNRELSWLKFNERVLEEAMDPSVPLVEQLKYIAIFISNLDEFFMIRVGSLYDLSLASPDILDNKSGLTPAGQLKRIFAYIRPLYQKKDDFYQRVMDDLGQLGITNAPVKALDKNGKKQISKYFRDYLHPILSPQIIDTHHPFPHLANKALYLVCLLQDDASKDLLGIVPVPVSLPPMVYLPGQGISFVLQEQILLHYAQDIFNVYTIKSKAVISVTRNADISPDDEMYTMTDDFRHHMAKMLKKRERLAPVRLEIQGNLDKAAIEMLCQRLKLKDHQVYHTTNPLTMQYVYQLADKLKGTAHKNLLYTPFTPVFPPHLDRTKSMLRQIQREDLLLHFPYDSIEPFLLLLKEAASDAATHSIRITIYRLASQSKIVDLLCTAAENGKDVTVLMELRARFDEENNIEWAERLEESGCRIIYGFDQFKVHSKVCLITRVEKGRVSYITQFGTGNYNEKTSALYTDLSLITANKEIGEDATAYFKNMLLGNLHGEYTHLLVAPSSLKTGLMNLIDEEIKKAARNEPASLLFKINSFTDREMLDKISEASCAGVKVQLIVRGICCLLPQVAEKTENVTIHSIVGRYLEHSRIYCFGTGNDRKIYIASADMMTRNLNRRVEIACPVFSPRLKQRIVELLETQWMDNSKTRLLLADAMYHKQPQGSTPLNCQEQFIEQAQQETQPNKRPFLERLKLFRRRR
ncbi:polyphosphate kinase 1 [Clostridia bacterium OttesenSCG-928-F22]|nr:polyphosphate kinase 1 [Clostridia bacterium OttesenSCG-928-F22]